MAEYTEHLKTTDGTPYTVTIIKRDGYDVERIASNLDGRALSTDIGLFNSPVPIDYVQEVLSILKKEGADVLTADKCAEMGHRFGCHGHKIYECAHAMVRCRDDGISRLLVQHGYICPPPRGSVLQINIKKEDVIKGKDSPARQQTAYADGIYYLYVREPCHFVLDQFPTVTNRTQTAFIHFTNDLTAAAVDNLFDMGKFVDTSKSTRTFGQLLLQQAVSSMLQSAANKNEKIKLTCGASTVTIPFRSKMAYSTAANSPMEAYAPSRLGSISRLCGNCNRSAFRKCARCARIVYCDQKCQKHDWNRHKPHCSKTENKKNPQ